MKDSAGKKLWGWYPAGKVWLPIQVDINGKPVVDMSAINLDDLADVSGFGAVEGDMLYFDQVSGTFMVGARANLAELLANTTILHDIGDVNIPAPADLDFIYWDNVAGQWVNMSFVNLVANILGSGNLDDLADVVVPTPADGDFLSYSTGLGIWQNRQLADTDIPNLDASKITTGMFAMARLPTSAKTLGIEFIIDGGGAVITTGQKGHLEIPFTCTIQRVELLADQVGSIVVDIWKDIYTNFPPDNADSITAAAPPTIAAAQKSQDVTLTGWTTAIYAGDILAFNIDSCATIERVTLSLMVERT